MPMNYEYVAIPDSEIPRATLPVFQHMLNTYAEIKMWAESQAIPRFIAAGSPGFATAPPCEDAATAFCRQKYNA